MCRGDPSGVYEGSTTGTPICLLIRNTDQRSKDYGNIPRHLPPGHADYTYRRSTAWCDPRGGGRFSWLTAPMVGAPARWRIVAARAARRSAFAGCMTHLGDIAIPFGLERVPNNPFFPPPTRAASSLAFRAVDARTRRRAIRSVRAASWSNDRRAAGPVNSPTTDADRLRDDGHQRPSRAIAGSAAGFGCVLQPALTRRRTDARTTLLHAGGVLGISTGAGLSRSRPQIEPTSSIRAPRASFERSGAPAVVQTFGRHDPCVGIRATPIAEAMPALKAMWTTCCAKRAQCADVRIATPPIPAQAPRCRE